MGLMGLTARVAVGVVLLAAGAAKLGQPSWRATAIAFGLPPRLAPALPWVELAVGAALLAGLGLPWTAWVALALLAAFTAVVALHLRRGDRAPCGCFGESPAPAPLGAVTVARNLVLCALALIAALTAGRGSGAVPVLAGVVVGAAVVLSARVAQHSN